MTAGGQDMPGGKTRDELRRNRIKLVEAMGWTKHPSEDWWQSPQHCSPSIKDNWPQGCYRIDTFLPDPETDAADDYRVLEWMRENYTSHEIDLAFDHIGYGYRWVYDVGTYAQAALSLIGGDADDCEECAALKVIDET